MRFEVSSPTRCLVKRRRLMSCDTMESDIAKAKLAAVSDKIGREVRVFATLTALSSEKVATEEPDDFYEFTAEDYFRILNTKKEDKMLKTRKIREAEQAARRSRITKAVIRVRFPDNHTLEVKFHPSETFQSLIDLLMKVIARPDLPFYIYTTPPKKQIKDMSQDFFSAGFIPGAIVYFSYDVPNGDECSGLTYLQEEMKSLIGLDYISEQPEPLQSASEPIVAESSINVQETKAVEKKPAMPKWFKR